MRFSTKCKQIDDINLLIDLTDGLTDWYKLKYFTMHLTDMQKLSQIITETIPVSRMVTHMNVLHNHVVHVCTNWKKSTRYLQQHIV